MDLLGVVVEKGVENGHVYEYQETGDEYLNVRTSTINIKVEVTPHERFERDKDNLKTSVNLTLSEALLGYNKNIKHMDSHNVRLNKIGTTNPGTVQKVIGEGMPHYQFSSEFGDLYVTYNVEFPDKLTDEQFALFKEAFE